MMKLAITSALLCLLPSVANGFAIRVDAHEEECFYETVTTGTKVSLLSHATNLLRAPFDLAG
jgi:p24 family protein beta-1